MANTLVRRTSKAREAKDTKKMAVNNIFRILRVPLFSQEVYYHPARGLSLERKVRR